MAASRASPRTRTQALSRTARRAPLSSTVGAWRPLRPHSFPKDDASAWPAHKQSTRASRVHSLTGSRQPRRCAPSFPARQLAAPQATPHSRDLPTRRQGSAGPPSGLSALLGWLGAFCGGRSRSDPRPRGRKGLLVGFPTAWAALSGGLTAVARLQRHQQRICACSARRASPAKTNARWKHGQRVSMLWYRQRQSLKHYSCHSCFSRTSPASTASRHCYCMQTMRSCCAFLSDLPTI